MTRMASLVILALLVASVAAAQMRPGTGDRPASPPRPTTGIGSDKAPEQYRSTGPGASLMSPGERRQMDQCTKFASWDYCKRQMLGN